MTGLCKLGLTGSIATGKSTALKAFAELGYPTFSADQAVHELYENEAVAAVTSAFPDAAANGRIDRQALSKILIQTPQRLGELEAIVHPLVREKIAQFIDRAGRDGDRLAVIDVPLLFESGHDYGFTAVAVTHCHPQEQRRRALERPGMTVEKLDTVLANQMPQEDKKSQADFLIDTNGTLAKTAEQVARIAQICLSNQHSETPAKQI